MSHSQKSRIKILVERRQPHGTSGPSGPAGPIGPPGPTGPQDLPVR